MHMNRDIGVLGKLALRRFLTLANLFIGLMLAMTLSPYTLLVSLVYFASAYWLTDHFDKRHFIGLSMEIRMIVSLVLFITLATS